MSEELSVCVLGSSSAGNSTLVGNGKTSFLIDCGFSPAYIGGQLHKFNEVISGLAGVFITHTHGDHVNEWTVKKLIEARVPIYCPSEIELPLQGRYKTLAHASHLGLLKPLGVPELALHGFLIRSFEVPHDSPGGCFGYSIFSDEGGRTSKISIATDMGFPTEQVVHHFTDSDVMVIESNHDVEMLENSGRPVWLKRRIREIGHLSNDECAEFTLNVLRKSKVVPQAILLAHISQQCNRNEIALETTREAISGTEFGSVKVMQTHKQRASEKFGLMKNHVLNS